MIKKFQYSIYLDDFSNVLKSANVAALYNGNKCKVKFANYLKKMQFCQKKPLDASVLCADEKSGGACQVCCRKFLMIRLAFVFKTFRAISCGEVIRGTTVISI